MKDYYKEVRRLSADSLRQLCIEKNWYTRGNNDEYEYLLYLVEQNENLSTEVIIAIAEDILIQSDLQKDDIEWIAYEIARKSYTYFEKI